MVESIVELNYQSDEVKTVSDRLLDKEELMAYLIETGTNTNHTIANALGVGVIAIRKTLGSMVKNEEISKTNATGSSDKPISAYHIGKYNPDELRNNKLRSSAMKFFRENGFKQRQIGVLDDRWIVKFMCTVLFEDKEVNGKLELVIEPMTYSKSLTVEKGDIPTIKKGQQRVVVCDSSETADNLKSNKAYVNTLFLIKTISKSNFKVFFVPYMMVKNGDKTEFVVYNPNKINLPIYPVDDKTALRFEMPYLKADKQRKKTEKGRKKAIETKKDKEKEV